MKLSHLLYKAKNAILTIPLQIINNHMPSEGQDCTYLTPDKVILPAKSGIYL